MAHSLGNVIACAAIKDFGLVPKQYYMLNAAVAMEAFDPTAEARTMVPNSWKTVTNTLLWASGWYRNFDGDDFRSTLSWKGRFAGIPNAVNCYSPTENVAGNDWGCAWRLQERFKGTGWMRAISNAVLLFSWSRIACEGGWGYNWHYFNDDMKRYFSGVSDVAVEFCKWTMTKVQWESMPHQPTEKEYDAMSPAFSDSANSLTREQSILHPLFTPFRRRPESLIPVFNEDATLHGTNKMAKAYGYDREQYLLRSRLLADAIPATSLPAGANALDVLKTGIANLSYDNCMANTNSWPVIDHGKRIWAHNDIKQMAYFFVYPLFDTIITGGKQIERKDGD